MHHKGSTSITVLHKNIRNIAKNFHEVSVVLEPLENIDIILLTDMGCTKQIILIKQIKIF